MKKVITKEVELCDRCGNNIDDTYSKLKYICPVCKRTICSNCKFGVMENYPDLCRDCITLPEIKERKKKFIDDYWERYHLEEKTLRRYSNKSVSKYVER